MLTWPFSVVKSLIFMVKSASNHHRLCTFRVFGGDVTTALHKTTKLSVASRNLTTLQKNELKSCGRTTEDNRFVFFWQLKRKNSSCDFCGLRSQSPMLTYSQRWNHDRGISQTISASLKVNFQKSAAKPPSLSSCCTCCKLVPSFPGYINGPRNAFFRCPLV